MSKKLASAAFAAAVALALLAPSAHAQKALVYCPVGVDAAGCDRVVSALQSKFAEGIDRGYDGSAGTVDLRKADLNHYSVVVVPSLADNSDKQPYGLLRSVAARLRMVINGRVAIYSGAPDQGSANRADKDAIIQNLASWAAKGHTRSASLVGLVAFLDLSDNESDRYGWVRDVSLVDVSADAELQAFPEVRTVSPRGIRLMASNDKALRFSNMASYGLHIGRHAAARTEVGAIGGASGAQSVLVTYANADEKDLDDAVSSTGRAGSSGASFSMTPGTSASLSTTTSTSGPTLVTDKADYAPGDTVLFTGSGWGAGDTVTITLHEDPQWSNPDRTVSAVADGGGNLSSHTFIVDQRDYGVTFTATAVANPSGFVAQTTFTDGNKISFSSTRLGAEQLTWPGTITPGACTGIWVQERQGSNIDSTHAARTVNLSSAPAGVTFHSASNCNGGSTITSVTIANNTPATQFFFKTSINATITGDGGLGSSNATTVVTVAGAVATTTTLASSVNPSLFNQSVTFTATVSATSGTPTGIVTLKDNGTSIGTGTLSTTAGVTTATFTTSSLSVATHPITADYAGVAGTFSASTSNTVSQVVNKASQTITFAPLLNKTYGDADFAVSATASSGLTVTFAVGVSDKCTITVATVHLTGAGSCTVTASQTGNANYDAAPSVPQTFSIAAKPITVTADAKNKTYGDADPALTYGVSPALLTGDVFTGALARLSGENVGPYAIQQGTLSAGTNYNITFVGANLTIAARPITVTADAKNKSYGDADPAFTYALTTGSLVGTDVFSGSLTRDVGEAVGAYAIKQGTLALSTNYALTYVGANLTIAARPITVTADPKTKIYGDADPALTYQVTTGSLVNGDAFAGSLVRAAGEPVATYAITQGSLALNANYALTFVGANFTVTPRPVTVTADAKTKVYGDVDPALTYQVTIGSLVTGDNFVGSLTRASGSNVGVYAITQATLALSSNYALTYAGANLTITTKGITVTAEAKSKVYGDGDPALTYQVTTGSLIAGDAFSGSLTRAAGENVGSHAIQQGSLTAGGNYALTYVGASLTITTRPITVTADAKSKVYGNADPSLTYQITAGSLVGTDVLTGALTRAPGEAVGTYAIQQGGLTAGANYVVTFVSANLTITTRPITVTADAQTKVYGNADPTLTYQVTAGSLAFSDAFSGNLSRAPGNAVGLYAIGQGSLTAGTNYVLTFVGANLTITARPITFTADAKSKTYGDVDPALTAQVTSGSLAYSDAPSGNLARLAGENVGTYAIQQGTFTMGPNYALTFVGANLTVLVRPITVTADAKSKVYGDADPALTYKVTSGSLVEGDAFTGALVRDAGETVATYTINKGTLALTTNYDVTFVGANLTITTRPIAIAADAKNKVYGAGDPALTYHVTSGSLAFTDAFSGALTRAAGENVGNYAITQGTVALNTNYALTYSGADLTISTRPITITADVKTKIYGNADPALTYAITSGSLVFSDAFSGTLSRASGENVGAYAITQGTVALSANYALTFVSKDLTITARPITVTADVQSKVYGNADPSLTYHLTSGTLVGSDGFSGVLTRAPGDPVGVYAIQQGTLTAGSNYGLTFVGANLTITVRPIVVTADAKSKVYGNGDPALTTQVTTGFLAYSDALSGSLSRGAGENVGSYPIQQNTFTAGANYALTYVGANLSITPRQVTVTPSAPDLTWTGVAQTPSYSFAVTVGALAFSEVPSVLGSGGFSPATVTAVGSYTATVTGLSNANYTILSTPGTVKVVDKTIPLGSITQLNPVALGSAGTLKVNITDVTTGNSNIIAWKYSLDGVNGPEIPVPAVQTPNVNVTASLPPYSASDVVTVCAQGEDAGGNWSLPVCSLLAIYDPSAGFVTGGGWFDSPAGAYAANTSLSGRANFGFVSKYQKGANVPTGNTEFQFQAGNLNFKSTSFSWLVISGTTQAQFKGVGTINGSGNYNFLVTVVDGDNFGNKKPDSFRIKITDAAGVVVYDNMMGADENSAAATVISGGSIQIQTK